MRASRTTATAAVMNELFVNIKVDREERPDVDAIYMGALHELGEQGGWPLTMFLTSDAEPFWGGTYFPKEQRYGRPAFVRVLNEVARIYRDEPRQGPAERRRAEGPAQAGAARHGAARRRRTPMLADLAGRLVQAVDPVEWRHQRRAEISAAAVLRISLARGSALRPAESARGGRPHAHAASRKAASTIISAAASRATPSTSAGSCRISRRCSTTTRSSSS